MTRTEKQDTDKHKHRHRHAWTHTEHTRKSTETHTNRVRQKDLHTEASSVSQLPHQPRRSENGFSFPLAGYYFSEDVTFAAGSLTWWRRGLPPAPFRQEAAVSAAWGSPPQLRTPLHGTHASHRCWSFAEQQLRLVLAGAVAELGIWECHAWQQLLASAPLPRPRLAQPSLQTSPPSLPRRPSFEALAGQGPVTSAFRRRLGLLPRRAASTAARMAAFASVWFPWEAPTTQSKVGSSRSTPPLATFSKLIRGRKV